MLSDTSPFSPRRVQLLHLRARGVSHLRDLQRQWERLWAHDFVFGSSEDVDRVEAGNTLIDVAWVILGEGSTVVGRATNEAWARSLVDTIEGVVMRDAPLPLAW